MFAVSRQVLEKMTREQLIEFSWRIVCELAEMQAESLDHQEIVEQIEGPKGHNDA